MNWIAVTVTAIVTVVAATAGNVLIPKAALAWFRSLNWPRWLVPYPVFIVVGAVYYLLMATVLYRALDRHDVLAIGWSIVVIVANEAWNVILFGLRSTFGGFVGILMFAGLLMALVMSAQEDRLSLALLLLYATWITYDIAWSFALWRRNPR